MIIPLHAPTMAMFEVTPLNSVFGKKKTHDTIKRGDNT
jgi:hypothetical protein